MASTIKEAESSNKAKVSILTSVAGTLLVTLAGRAQDAAKATNDPTRLLGDTWAQSTLDRLDYTAAPTSTSQTIYAVVLLRSRLFDVWTSEFLAAHPGEDVIVLNLACGLDSRALRLDWTSGRRNTTWIDVDLPEVVDLRRQVMPAPERGDYRLLVASVTGENWLDDLPADRPTLIIAEGLLSFLQPTDVQLLFQRICDRFPSGQIMCDVNGVWYKRLQVLNRDIQKTGAGVHFTSEYVADMEVFHEKLKARDELRLWYIPGVEVLPFRLRALMWILSWMPGLNRIGSEYRFDF
ncbi:S-adenosyl-L-methionine-dependent methyltransferase [Podospora didyma]|uniref:S-adenosyl-L-methionine-dependent methyltransferase n=1 Tax=Podospora didyma TaxID=330526 RepID=A0AAE0TV85_9PEZI|nr:S-adenosyl-L-methionine-dependent methyltransferase [Podospora didyma]